MRLTKVSTIDFDLKDCELLTCPNCQGASKHFMVFVMTQKANHEHQHLHVRCMFCEAAFCLEQPPMVAGQ